VTNTKANTRVNTRANMRANTRANMRADTRVNMKGVEYGKLNQIKIDHQYIATGMLFLL